MYKTTIGLEIHVQLKTKSKMFCGCDNNAENTKPNTLVCPVCLGMPGVLPVANKQAIEWVILTGLALNSEITEKSKFDRKNYFYPDLPKGYQISQFDQPFCKGGYLEINNRKINLTRIHLEEDAGKLIHKNNYSLVDLNRAGTPLMEIVTEPEIESPAEAKEFMQELRAILRYLSVSDANMEKGHLRCDANISLCEIKNQNTKIKTGNYQELGVPIEIKNINSFKMLEKALAYEEKRQREVLESGGKIEKETRGWDDAKRITYSQRSKEIASDYRYFPEPDIPPFEIRKLFNIESLKNNLPELPAKKRNHYINDWQISQNDSKILASESKYADYFEKIANEVSPKLAANWIVNELKPENTQKVEADRFIEFLKLVENKKISGQNAKEVLLEIINSDKIAQKIINEKELKQVDDKNELSAIIDKIIKNNPKPMADLKSGKNEAFGFLVGLVMRETKGQVDPEKVNEILREKLK